MRQVIGSTAAIAMCMVRVLDPAGEVVRHCSTRRSVDLHRFRVRGRATRHASRHEFGGRPSWGALSHDGFQNSRQDVIFHALRD